MKSSNCQLPWFQIAYIDLGPGMYSISQYIWTCFWIIIKRIQREVPLQSSFVCAHCRVELAPVFPSHALYVSMGLVQMILILHSHQSCIHVQWFLVIYYMCTCFHVLIYAFFHVNIEHLCSCRQLCCFILTVFIETSLCSLWSVVAWSFVARWVYERVAGRGETRCRCEATPAGPRCPGLQPGQHPGQQRAFSPARFSSTSSFSPACFFFDFKLQPSLPSDFKLSE